jgi:hypothetical protein
MSGNRYYIPRELADAAVGNNKALSSTENVGLLLEILRVDVTTTATVGNRSIDVVIEDDGAVELARITLTPVIAASQTNVVSYIYPGSADGELPPFVFRPGYVLRTLDTNAVDVLDTVAVRAFFAGQGPIG